MDYTKTLNLPKTSFPMKANLPKKELEILKFWEENKIYEKLQNNSKGKRKFILHDGPPYPNGDVHLGTAFNKFLKDIIVKYKSMQDLDSPYVPGWDCHGMPIEHIVVENLGKDVEKYSQIEIRKKCREYALQYVDVQREQFKRLGVRGEWDNPYLTLAKSYEAKIVETFMTLLERGYIYKGLRPIYWCTNCQTALAEAEVEYDDHQSPSIYVKFQTLSDGPSFFVIWTTTPWTLPANVAIAVHPEYDYVYVEIKNDKKEILVVAKELLNAVVEKIGTANYQIVKTVKGKELEGLKCKHPFVEREVVIILADYVTVDTGTGCVHIAPGHGQEDYLSSIKYNLPLIAPVDNLGNFTKDAGEFAGINVFEANSLINKRLKDLDKLLFEESIVHSYPHCWRCHSPIIFRATEQWFFDMEKNNLREKTLKNIPEVSWIPKWGQEKMYNLIKQRPDWCISRQRSWGVPIPIFYCKNCNKEILDKKIMTLIKEKVKEEGVDFWFEKDAEEILPKDFKCLECGGGEFRKEKDILDVWFESGVSFVGVLQEREYLNYPADIYLEATDQHRGWFQSSLWPSMAIENKPPFKTVITHGLILDADGKKMSKSRGNVISPQEVIDKYGADILRLWFSSVDYTSDVRLSSEILEPIVDAYRKMRNTFRYILGNLYDFDINKDFIPYEKLLEIDKWILLKLHKVIEKIITSYENYQFYSVYHTIHNFCIVELSSFYLDVLKDRLYTFASDSLERHSAQTVLYQILNSLVKMVFPIISYTAEEVWQNLRECSLGLKESVQLCTFPKVEKKYLDEELEKKWEKILILREEVNKALEIARNEKKIKTSLESKVLIYTNDDTKNFINSIPDLKSILIVSDIEIFSLETSPEVCYHGEKMKGLRIFIEKAGGQKCERCWNYSESVGRDSEYPDICERCLKVVKK